MTRLIARRYDTLEPVRLRWDNGRLKEVRPWSPPASFSPDTLPVVLPGLVDLQVNGHGGQEFVDDRLTVEGVIRISHAQAAVGVTAYCPTLTTHRFETLCHGMRQIAAACEQDARTARTVAGIHLEGPYISKEDGPRGAHPLAHCRPPDWDEFQRLQDAAQGRIRILTLSPEFDGACAFIEKVAATGVVVALGHTAASPQQIRDAASAGARMSTHLGNGAHGQIRRHPNYIWEQLAEDRLIASLIVDGHHLPPSVVQSFVRAKTPDRCVLVSDITGLGGMPPGEYTTGLGTVEILEDGRMVIGGQRQLLAGAARPLIDGLPNVMRFAGIGLRVAVDMCCIRPAQLVEWPPARLEAGSPADLLLVRLSEDGFPLPAPVATVLGGEVCHGALPDVVENANAAE